MTSLVTGAGGFVGSRLVRLLAARGEPVRAMVRHGSSPRALAGLDAELVRGDVRIADEVYRALAGCTRLYHVAATYSFAPDARTMVADALEATDAVMSAALRRGLERVVLTSSVASIGSMGEPTEMTESALWSERDDGAIPYVLAKRRAEERALEWADKGVALVVVNPAGVYGPGDWKPTPSGAAVLRMLRKGIPAWSEGGMSITDVDDVAAGHAAAMSRGRVGQRYILGGENLTTRAIFDLLAELCGRAAPRVRASRGAAALTGLAVQTLAKLTGREPELTREMASGVGRYYWVSSGKAERELEYSHRPARETLARAVRWYVDNGYLSGSERATA